MTTFELLFTQLHVAFQHGAARYPWAGALCHTKNGRLHSMQFGRSPAAGFLTTEGLTQKEQYGVNRDLGKLTERAGTIISKLIRSGRYKPRSGARTNWEVEIWLKVLMDSDPNCYRCVADTPSEKRCLFAEGTVRAWIDNYPQVCVDVLAELRGGLRVTSDPEGRPLAGTVGTTKSRRDGTEAGCWLWWKGKRHDVPKGVVYRLLEYFWNRDSAGYDELNISVFDSSVQPQTVR